MLHGTPTHRPSAPGVALLVKPVGTAGQHRHPAPSSRSPRFRSRTSPDSRPQTSPGSRPQTSPGFRPQTSPGFRPRTRRRREPQRAVHLITKGLAALIMLGVTGMIGYLMVADRRHGHNAEAATTAGLADQPASRAVDPAPLTLEEVFPDPAEVPAAGTPRSYRITMTHIDTDCRIATTGTLGRLLQQHGCSQVVRAGLIAPYGDYEVTAGLFNLSDAAGATEVDGLLRHLVETGDGSFAAMAGGAEPGTDPTAAPTAQVGWHTRGHYLLYCVITRPDGQVVPDGDQNATRITADLVDGYLGENVLGRRAATR
jgi:hypothetical protein